MTKTFQHSVRQLTAPVQRTEPIDRLAINFLWFHKLRWTAILGQFLAVVLFRWAFSIDLPWQMMIGLIAALAATNVVLGLWLNARRTHGWHGWQNNGVAVLGSVMTLDNLVLTANLYLSGGPANPFTIFYLINISLAAVVFSARWSWFLCGLALTCYALLFWQNIPIPELGCCGPVNGSAANQRHLFDTESPRPTIDAADAMNFHLQGMLIAFGAASALIVYFITRVTTSLTQRETELALVREQKAHHDKLESLATLAAGAAHELATPLSTIAIVARELEFDLRDIPESESIARDVQVIRAEIERCRRILDSMATSAGESVGEEIAVTTVHAIVEETLAGAASPDRIRTSFVGDIGERRCRTPVIAFGQAVRVLLKNALDASADDGFIEIEVREVDRCVAITVADSGTGMPDDVLRRVGDPFFSTKEPGHGMGLGLFLARQVIERLGGTLTLNSRLGVGTTAMIELPLDRDPDRAEADPIRDAVASPS